MLNHMCPLVGLKVTSLCCQFYEKSLSTASAKADVSSNQREKSTGEAHTSCRCSKSWGENVTAIVARQNQSNNWVFSLPPYSMLNTISIKPQGKCSLHTEYPSLFLFSPLICWRVCLFHAIYSMWVLCQECWINTQWYLGIVGVCVFQHLIML